jgi:hypothetical protein
MSPQERLPAGQLVFRCDLRDARLSKLRHVPDGKRAVVVSLPQQYNGGGGYEARC